MTNRHFGYQAEKLDQARSSLMVPHAQGEAASIADAFELCDRAFSHFDDLSVDEHAREWIQTIKSLMDTSGLNDASGRGLWTLRAEKLSLNEKLELSRAIDELASWFNRAIWDPETSASH